MRHWSSELDRRGVRRAWPALAHEAGDPISGLQVAARALRGIYLGERVPPSRKGSHVIPSNLSWVVTGTPNAGKTTAVALPALQQQLAAGHNVVLVTPQDNTVDAVYPLAHALTGGNIRVIDHGGELVNQDTERLVTWDPTRGCDDPEKAMKFAESFAGPSTPLQDDLKKGGGARYWAQLPKGMLAAAAHLTAHERRANGLNPEGHSGMTAALDYLRRPDPGEIRTELTTEQKKHYGPRQAAEIERCLRAAARHVADFQFHPEVQRMAYGGALLAVQGVKVSDEIAGPRLLALSDMHYENDKGRGNPARQLFGLMQEALPPPEVRTMSPSPDDVETSAEELAHANGGLTIIGYSKNARTPGLAAGVLADSIMRAALIESTDRRVAARIPGAVVPPPVRVGFYVDEGGALEYVDLDRAVTDGRQLGVSAKILVTSVEHLEREVGEERSKTLLQSVPVRIDLTPPPDKADEAATAFGTKEVTEKQETVIVDPFNTMTGTQETTSWKKVPKVQGSDLANLPRGTAKVTDRTAPKDKELLVELPEPGEPGTPVADADAYARVADHPGADWAAMRPDLVERFVPRPRPPEIGQTDREPGALPRPTDVGSGDDPAPPNAGDPPRAADPAEPDVTAPPPPPPPPPPAPGGGAI